MCTRAHPRRMDCRPESAGRSGSWSRIAGASKGAGLPLSWTKAEKGKMGKESVGGPWRIIRLDGMMVRACRSSNQISILLPLRQSCMSTAGFQSLGLRHTAAYASVPVQRACLAVRDGPWTGVFHYPREFYHLRPLVPLFRSRHISLWTTLLDFRVVSPIRIYPKTDAFSVFIERACLKAARPDQTSPYATGRKVAS